MYQNNINRCAIIQIVVEELTGQTPLGTDLPVAAEYVDDDGEDDEPRKRKAHRAQESNNNRTMDRCGASAL